MSILSKQGIKERVDRTVDRISRYHDAYDEVHVAFSGGKDSTIMMECAILASQKLGKKKTPVYFLDHELVGRKTLEYIDRVKARPEVDFRHYCLPFRCNNACDLQNPYWWPWDRRVEHKWHRKLPEDAITKMRGFSPDMNMHAVGKCYANSFRPINVIQLIGLRADESPIRRGYLHRLRVENTNYISKNGQEAYPVCDWMDMQIWGAIEDYDWDFSEEYYDKFQVTGSRRKRMRVGPIAPEEGIKELRTVAEWDPELFRATMNRLHEAEFGARYSKSALMGAGLHTKAGAGYDRKFIEEKLNSMHPNLAQATHRGMINIINFCLASKIQLKPDLFAKMVMRGDRIMRRTIAYRTIEIRKNKLDGKYRLAYNGKILNIERYFKSLRNMETKLLNEKFKKQRVREIKAKKKKERENAKKSSSSS